MEEFDKEKAIEDIAKKLNVEKNKILYIEYSNLFQINDCVISIIDDNIKVFQEYNLYFYRCTIPNLILEITIKSLEFKMCCFESSFMIRNNFDGYISIQDSIFEKDFGIFWVKKEIYKINVCKNTFKDVSIFENKILNFNFEENSIQNISIYNNLFTKEAYFNANSFNYECIFFKNSFENLSFYGANFEKSFIFFQNIIKGNLNAVNTNLNFTFDDLQKRIKQEYEDFNKTKEEQDKKPLDKFANDFRDSFRTFKSALIKDNNLLDASNFHKYELYCKEIELKESWNKLKKVDMDEDIDQNNKNYSKLIDFLLLGFYRKLCDHHTDLLKVFNSFVLLIALYILYSIVILHINDKKIINDTKTYLSDIFNYNNIFWYILGILLFICVCSIYFCKNKERTHMINEKVKVKKIKWSKIIIKEIYNLLFILIICYTSVSIFSMVGVLLAKFFDLKIFKDVAYISFACLSFVGLFLFFINSRVLRYIFLSCSYFIFAFVLFLNPKEFYFIYNIFKENNENLMIINSLNVVYFVLIILILFSLQKTARKNSIVPN
ncbi:pentapeptide repeat-containing protein [Campylobacter sp. TTU_617]|uniref:pentapeptide repeat-containing protein n=1 Tax=Campylobacter sp. TTU_617 TaxID=2768148 RepID=UPI001F23723F|nr:pentapeptide repeat-containing protein [Campylobacter sp. TTU_617]